MFIYFRRIAFFLLTNLAVMTLLGVVLFFIETFFPGITKSLGGYGSIVIFAILYGFGGAFISLWISRYMAKVSYGIKLLDPERISTAHEKLQIVYMTVARISKDHHISIPEVGYYESAEPNAFATGATKNSSLVAVSTGLLNCMEKQEIEGVIGHEMAHILNGDMVTLTLIQGILNAFVIIFASILARIVASFLEKDRENALSHFAYYAIYNIFQVILGFFAMFVVMWFSRMREYRADLGGAQYTSKAKMISGLRKLQKMTKLVHTEPTDKKMSAFMINEPDSFFSTHPSLDNRIQALEENYQLA